MPYNIQERVTYPPSEEKTGNCPLKDQHVLGDILPEDPFHFLPFLCFLPKPNFRTAKRVRPLPLHHETLVRLAKKRAILQISRMSMSTRKQQQQQQQKQ